MFLRNTWYVVAWADEIAETPFNRRILDQEVLLLRDAEGEVHAMQDRCPHHFAPLHSGKRVGDTIECPYHGLRFATDGRCVHNPHGDGIIPRAARLAVWPVVERHGLIWMWPGDATCADADLIPDFSFLGDSGWTLNKGYLHGVGDYQLYADNILDLGHAEFLHEGLGAPAFTKAPREIIQDGDTVWSNIASFNDFLAPLHAEIKQLQDRRLDWWVDVRWDAPATMGLDVYVDEVGGRRETAQWVDRGCHIMTPESEHSTHYFWATARNYRTDGQALTDAIQVGFVHAFETEDKPTIAAQHAMMEQQEFWSLKPVLSAGDAGGVRARRVLQRLIERERHVSGAQQPSVNAISTTGEMK